MFGVWDLDNEKWFDAIREEREKKMAPDYVITDADKALKRANEEFELNRNQRQLTLEDIPKDQLAKLMSDLKEEIKRDMKTEAEQAAEEERLRKERIMAEREKYVNAMKESDEPWMDIEAWDEDGTGARIQLDWNDAFIKHLRNNNITGTDDDQVIQKWLILLMEDMTMRNIEKEDEGDFE